MSRNAVQRIVVVVVVFATTVYMIGDRIKYPDFRFRLPFNSSSVWRPLAKLNIQSLDQSSEVLHDYIREHHLIPPSNLPYNFPNATKFDELIAVNVLPPRFKRRKGFFLEAGANDGVASSFTLALEVIYGWTGLLVECNPELVPRLKSLNRKAYIADVCLSKSKHPTKSEMTSVDNWMAASSLGSAPELFPDYATGFTKFDVQTMPLYAILAAIGVTEVDYAVLDVQSLELDVLRNFPFHLIFVKVWLVEYELLSVDDRNELLNLMHGNGYNSSLFNFAGDYYFIHNSLI